MYENKPRFEINHGGPGSVKVYPDTYMYKEKYFMECPRPEGTKRMLWGTEDK